MSSRLQKKHHAKARQRVTAQRRSASHVIAARQPAAQGLQQSSRGLGLPEDLVTRSQGACVADKLLGKIVGVMCPPLFGCRTNSECAGCEAGIKTSVTSARRAAPALLVKRLRRLGLDVLVPLWCYAASAVRPHGAAGNGPDRDDSVFKKYGEQLGLVGTWWSGQEHRYSPVLMASCWSWSRRWQTGRARRLCHPAA